MKNLQPLPWQQDLWMDLTGQYQAGRLHHALLLAGPQGVGKRHFARALAAFMLCEQRAEAGGATACGKCRACQQLSAGTQPNASHISVDGHLGLTLGERGELTLAHWAPDDKSKRQNIAIHAVRSFMEQVTLSSHRGGSRVALVEPAEWLNAASLNAFLKTVEEPPAGTFLIFISEQPSLIKATLRSRCQLLRLPLPPRAQALHWLSGQGLRSAEELLDEAHGAPLTALADAELGSAEHHAQWRESMEQLARQKTDPLSVAASIGKDDAVSFLRWLAGWLTVQLRPRHAAVASASTLSRFYPEVMDAAHKLDGNANPALALEALMVTWWRLCRMQKAA